VPDLLLNAICKGNVRATGETPGGQDRPV